MEDYNKVETKKANRFGLNFSEKVLCNLACSKSFNEINLAIFNRILSSPIDKVAKIVFPNIFSDFNLINEKIYKSSFTEFLLEFETGRELIKVLIAIACEKLDLSDPENFEKLVRLAKQVDKELRKIRIGLQSLED